MNEFKKGYTTRTEKRKFEEEIEKRKEARAKELDESRRELKKLIFDDDEEIGAAYKQKEKNKKPHFANFFLSLTLLAAFTFVTIIIYNIPNSLNPLYELINAVLLLLIILGFTVSFKRSYHYKKTAASVFTAFGLIGLMTFNALYYMNVLALPKPITVPNLVNKDINNTIKWAEQNKIKYNSSYEYSDSIKKFNVISQSVKPGTPIKNVDKINLEVSNGPDYNKEVFLTDMTNMNIDKASKIIEKNFLNNVHIKYETNEKIKKDTIISQNKIGTITRNDTVELTVSFGNSKPSESITMKNMKNLSLYKATLFLERNGIDYQLKYSFSDKISKGNITKSSVKKGETVKPGDTVILIVSKGKKIAIPEFKNMTTNELTKWITNNNVKIKYSEKYSDEVKEGHVIESSHKKGDVIEEGEEISIIVSKGQPIEMPDFNGKTKEEIEKVCEEKSLNCTFKISDETREKEVCVYQSIKSGNKVTSEENINIYISAKEN